MDPLFPKIKSCPKGCNSWVSPDMFIGLPIKITYAEYKCPQCNHTWTIGIKNYS